MKGGIVERSASAPKPMQLTGKPDVKPVAMAPVRKLASDGAAVSKPQLPVLSSRKTVPAVEEEDLDENDLIIKNMTPEELQDAMGEISTLLSKQNIEFLLGKGKPSQKHSLQSVKEDASPNGYDSDEPPELEDFSVPAAHDDGVASIQKKDMNNDAHYNLDGIRVFSTLADAGDVFFNNAVSVLNQVTLPADVVSATAYSITASLLKEFDGGMFSLWAEDEDAYDIQRILEVLC